MKVFGSWHEEWRLNSGITRVEKDGKYWLLFGYSGSCYRCHEDSYGISNPYSLAVLNDYDLSAVSASEALDYLCDNTKTTRDDTDAEMKEEA